ncbi:MAG TPA: hypothetical protein VIG68_02405 [Lysobacter sp.]
MNPNRILAGWTCLALAFAVVVLLGTGLVDPPGVAAARSASELLGAYVPFLGGALALFAVGLWLIRRPRRR